MGRPTNPQRLPANGCTRYGTPEHPFLDITTRDLTLSGDMEMLPGGQAVGRDPVTGKLVRIPGGGGMSAVMTDASMRGDGTATNRLGVELSSATDSAAADRAATPAAVKAAYDVAAAALPVVTTPQVYHIDPVGGDDTTAKPTTSTADASTPYKTYAAAMDAACTVFHQYVGSVTFWQKSGTLAAEAVSVRAPDGTYGSVRFAGEDVTAKVRAPSGATFTVSNIFRQVVFNTLDISSESGNGIYSGTTRLVGIQNCRIGDCVSGSLVTATYGTEIQMSTGNVFYGTSLRGLASFYDGLILARDGSITIEENTAFTTASLYAYYNSKIVMQVAFSGNIPIGPRWSVSNSQLVVNAVNVSSFGTDVGTTAGNGSIFATNAPENRKSTSAATIYVATTGDDDVAYWMGGTSAYPFATPQAAVDYVCSCNFDRGILVTISIGSGNFPLFTLTENNAKYSSGIINTSTYGYIIQGAGETTIIGSGAENLSSLFMNGGVWQIQNLTLHSDNDANYCYAIAVSGGHLTLAGTVHITGKHYLMVNCGRNGVVFFRGAVNSTSTYVYSVFHANVGGVILGQACTFNFNGAAMTLTGAFAQCYAGAKISMNAIVAGWITNYAGIVGKKYACAGIGDIDVGGRVLAGDTAGTDASGLSRIFAI